MQGVYKTKSQNGLFYKTTTIDTGYDGPLLVGCDAGLNPKSSNALK